MEADIRIYGIEGLRLNAYAGDLLERFTVFSGDVRPINTMSTASLDPNREMQLRGYEVCHQVGFKDPVAHDLLDPVIFRRIGSKKPLTLVFPGEVGRFRIGKRLVEIVHYPPTERPLGRCKGV